MIKIGDIKKFKDVDGSTIEGEVVFISTFNYVVKVPEGLSPINCTDNIESKLLESLGFGHADPNYFYVVLNKPVYDVVKKYRQGYKFFVDSMKVYEYKGCVGLGWTPEIDYIPCYVNMNQLCKLYKIETFMDDYYNFISENI